MRQFLRLVPAALLLLLCACAPAKPVATGDPAKDHFLGSEYGKMTQVVGHKERFTWRNPSFNPKNYSAVLLDPSVIWNAEGMIKDSGVTREELDEVARHLDAVLRKTMTSIDFPLKDAPAPRTMRISAAVTQVRASNPTMNTISSVLPVGIVLGLAGKATSGTYRNVGSCTIEVRFSDAMTGETLGLFADHKDGDKYDSANFSKMGQAEKAIDQWAELLREGILRNWGVRKD